MSERIPLPRKEKEYPAIREMFRIPHSVSVEAFRETFRDIPIPQVPPISERPLEPGEQIPLSKGEIEGLITSTYEYVRQYWKEVFRAEGWHHEGSALKIFSGEIKTACGEWSEGRGPMFCSADNTIYFPPSSYTKLQERFFAAANEHSITYLISHEMAHYAQNQIGIAQKSMNAMKRAQNPEEEAYIDRAIELHADFLAGCTLRKAHDSAGILQQDDAIRLYWMAASLGDDVSHVRHDRRVAPAHLTHGLALERAQALWAGLSSGDWKQAEAFINTHFNTSEKTS
ncbi:neutral zinc metallopeptidase [Candidatus Kaiserbacteria bacterium]|nr:neutral zinc metallopeptidase [Candidatus Kaiserbacteria bacterium]